MDSGSGQDAGAVTDSGIGQDAGAVTDSGIGLDAGVIEGGDGGVNDDCDPNRFTPVGTTLEDMLNGEMDRELDRLRDLCLKKKEGFTLNDEEEMKVGDEMTLKQSVSEMTLSSWSSGSSPISPGFQRAFRYLGNSADGNEHGNWFESIAGITNDANYWYFSKNDPMQIFKTNYSENLNDNFNIVEDWSGDIRDCNHFGDIDYYDGLIVVGVEGCSDSKARFAFFKASTLDLLAYVDDEHNVMNDSRAPWVAVRNGRLFSSKGGREVEVIHEWEVDWDLIPSNPPAAELDYDEFVQDFDSDGFRHKTHKVTDIYYSGGDSEWADNKLHYIQGADFSDDGSVFYVSAGYCKYEKILGIPHCEWCSPRQLRVFQVYENQDWPQIKWSSYTEYPFKFPVETNTCDEEPEGITYFDTNRISGYGSNKRGELIVELADQEAGYNDIYIKHYTSIIDVNPEEGIGAALTCKWKIWYCDCGSNIHCDEGDPGCSYDYDCAGAWNGSILELEAGTYDESIGISYSEHRVKMVSKGGAAMIHP